MKSIYYFLLLNATLLIAGSSRGQSILRIDPNLLVDSLRANSYTLSNDTIPTASFGVRVYNTSNQLFSDSIAFGYSIGAGGFINTFLSPNFIHSGIGFPWQPVTIQAHGSVVLYSLDFYVTSPDFVVGSSTVVIWPIAYHNPTLAPADSAGTTILVVPSGISSTEISEVKVYMSGTSLLVKNASESGLGYIRIYNAMGALVTGEKMSKNADIPMEQYAAGMYMVEVTLDNGKHGIYKVTNMPLR